MQALKLKVLEKITLDLSDINYASQDDTERQHLNVQKAALEKKKEALSKELAVKVGELMFYYEELDRIDDRLQELDGGEHDEQDVE